MKGIIINEGSPLLENKYVNACYIKNADLTVQPSIGEETSYNLSGVINKSANACCSKKDTYDFETDALIALMKMCGLEKSAKAYAEIFDDTAYGDALIKIKNLKEKVNDLWDYNKKLIDEIDQKNHEIISLKDLKLANESLKKDNESFRKTCDKLKEENECLKNEMHLLMSKNNELIEKKKDLKKKLNAMYGYVDTDNASTCPADYWDGDVRDIVFLPGRACGKQYKALVELFKKIDQKKVDAAYKEAYNVTLPVWQKEAPRQAYGIYKESREKAELPRTLDINGTTYRKGVSLKDLHKAFTIEHGPFITGRDFEKDLISQMNMILSICKPLTKREKMWADIKCFDGDSCIEVDRANVIDFLEELEKEMPNAHWPTGNKPTSNKPMFNYKYLAEYNKIYFFIGGDYMTYSHDKETSRTNVQYITYLPPMRWDLFKKGRLAVKFNYYNYKEFYEACEKVLGKTPSAYPILSDDVTISICKKDGYFEIFTIEDQKKTGKKIVDWEDVR